MKLETKKKLGAIIGYPLTFLFIFSDNTDAEKKYTLEMRRVFKSRCFWKRLL